MSGKTINMPKKLEIKMSLRTTKCINNIGEQWEISLGDCTSID